MFKKYNYNNKLILLTGGTSGIGYSILNILHNQNCNIAILGTNEKKLEEIEKTTKLNSNIKVYKFDLSRIEEIKIIIEKIQKDFQMNISVFISCAAIGAISLIEDLPEEYLKKIHLVNSLAPFIITKYIISNMKKNNDGQLIYLSSGAGFRGLPHNSAYSSSKFSLNGWIESLRVEIYNHNIDVISISPGPTKTNNVSRTKVFGNIKNIDNKKLSNPNDVAKKIFITMQNRKKHLRPLVFGNFARHINYFSSYIFDKILYHIFIKK